MGAPKAWLELHGRPLLVHVIERVGVSCQPIVIAAAPELELPLLDAPVVRVDDPPDLCDRGPLVGVVTGLGALAERGIERAYLGACDAAALTEAHVELMLRRLDAGSADAVVPVDDDGRLHPLAAALRLEPVLAKARDALASGRLRLIDLFESLATLERVPTSELPDPSVLEPCNTPEQWAALRARLE